MTTMRVGIVSIWQETNTYSPRVTRLPDFQDFELLEGEGLLEHNRGTGSVVGGFLDGLEETEAVGLMAAGAWPAAPPDKETTDQLLAQLDSALRSAPDLDGLLVNLHGAMVTATHSDMEAETLRRLRVCFPAIPIAAVLDLHANFSAEACALCDAVIGYRTYPHVDMADCGREAAGLMLRALNGEHFVTAYRKLGVLTTPLGQGTADEPMRSLIARAEERAEAAQVERVSLLPGFPYSDVDRCGFGILAVAVRQQASAALELVDEIASDVEAHLDEFVVKRPGPAEAVREALARPNKPVVLADVADNVGGGSPGDGTALLAELVRQQAAGAVVIIADAAAAAEAHTVGVGNDLTIELGGKSDAMHGDPVRISCSVVRLGDGQYVAKGSWMTGQKFSMGPVAVLELKEGITVVATTRAIPPFHIEQLTSVGVDPSSASIIVAKGAVAWRAAYESVMGSAIEVDTPGCCPVDPQVLKRATTPRAVESNIPAASKRHIG